MSAFFRYLGMALGFVGCSMVLTPIVASIARNAGLRGARVSDEVYLVAGLGLGIALIGLACWALGEFERSLHRS